MAGKKRPARKVPAKKRQKAARQPIGPAPCKRGERKVRANPSARTDLSKTERVRHIVDLMTTGQFVTARTVHELAVQWGKHEDSVSADAAEASRLVRGAVQSSEEIQARLVAVLDEVIRRSMGNKFSGRTVVEAIKAQAAITGCEAPKQSKVEVSGNLAALLALAKNEEDEPNADPSPAVCRGNREPRRVHGSG